VHNRRIILVAVAILASPLVSSWGDGCRPAGQSNSSVEDCELNPIPRSANSGVLCLRYPGASGASQTRVWVAGSTGLEWRPTAFPTSFRVPFGEKVFVNTSLGDAAFRETPVVTREKPFVEILIPLQDGPSGFLFGYRWADLPKETGLRPTQPVRAVEPAARMFEWLGVWSRFLAQEALVVVDAEGSIFRAGRPHGTGPLEWWCVGYIERAVFIAMKILRDQAVKAEMIRVGRSACDDCQQLGVQVYGAPSTPKEGVTLARGGESETERRSCPATDVLVPWIVQLMQTAPSPPSGRD
jgi:hypothetical protein